MGTVEFAQPQVVEPVLDHAAVENARLVNAARARLLTSATAVTVEQIAAATGRDPGTVRRWIARHRDAGRLVTVTHDGLLLVPAVQLDEVFGLDDQVAEIVDRLVAHGMDGWAVWHWLETPDTWLDGASPAQRLRAGDIDAVRRAVAGMFQE